MFNYNDGGRKAAGFVGHSGDCVVRAIAIATGESYLQIYNQLNELRDGLRQTRRVKASSARNGVDRLVYDRFLKAKGWKWVPAMKIGSGCKIHLRADELPSGNIICRVSKHMVAVVNGIINDNHNPARGGTRCVYGYYQKED